MPDQHRALRHLGRDRVVGGAVVGAVVGEVRARDEPRRAVGLGEVGERPHRVAHGRRVRLRQRDELVVGVDRLRDLAGEDVDRRQRRDEAARVEHALDDRQHVLVHRHALPERRRTRAGCRSRSVLWPSNEFGAGCTSRYRSSRASEVVQLVDEVGLDRVLDDRVALFGDFLHVQVDRPSATAIQTSAHDPLRPRRHRAPHRPDAFVHPDCTIIGNVVIGAGSTIWPQAVLRGDQSRIVVGARTSVQDGAVLHCTRELETIVGRRLHDRAPRASRRLHGRGRRAHRHGLDRAAPRDRALGRARGRGRGRPERHGGAGRGDGARRPRRDPRQAR